MTAVLSNSDATLTVQTPGTTTPSTAPAPAADVDPATANGRRQAIKPGPQTQRRWPQFE
jgi:hypothetical protein